MKLPRALESVSAAPRAAAATSGLLTLAAFAAGAPREARMFFAFSFAVLVAAAVLIPRFCAADGVLSERFLTAALLARLTGCAVFYAIVQSLYRGWADAKIYLREGTLIATGLRSLHLVPVSALGPVSGSSKAIAYAAGAVFALTGPTLLGASVLWSAISFAGALLFYKGFRTAFPTGNARLYAWLIFFLPSMLFWPSLIGKEAPALLFLGLVVFGAALIFSGRPIAGAVYSVTASAGLFLIRPPVAAGVLSIAAVAVLAFPGAKRDRDSYAAGVFVAIFAGVAVRFVIGSGGLASAFQSAVSSAHGGATPFTRTNFTVNKPFTPIGVVVALATVLLRPFPWEMKTPLEIPVELEILFLIAVIVWHRREFLEGLSRWRKFPMVPAVILWCVFLSLALSALGNFGLLARQRTQLYPLLFFLPAWSSIPMRTRNRMPSRAK